MRSIIIGTDWWTDCDDVAALKLACRAHREGVWTVAGVALNACMEYSAPSLDGFIKSEGLELPIGLDSGATDFGGRPPYQKYLADTTGSTLANSDCEDAVSLYRRILADSPDGSVELVEIGYPQVLAALLESDGRELVARKVKHLLMMAGNWSGEVGRENNFARNRRSREAASRLLERYPGEIIFLGFEVGERVMTRPKSGLVADAFRLHGSAGGRSSWDPMLVELALLCPNSTDAELESAGYEAVRGIATVDAETGENRFTRDDSGRHRYVKKLLADEVYEERLERLIH